MDITNKKPKTRSPSPSDSYNPFSYLGEKMALGTAIQGSPAPLKKNESKLSEACISLGSSIYEQALNNKKEK